MKKIIMTGGGTAGHVTPNLALIPKLKELGYSVEYIGTKEGIERKIIKGENIKYHIISTGKLRRYFDIKNFTDPLKVVKGVIQAAAIIRKVKPDIVFSKGGFVAVPVVIGAYLNRVPVVAHESDLTPGLANKLSTPYCTKVCVTFPESLKYIKQGKAVLTGTPIRKELFKGSKTIGKKLCGFEYDREILLIIGGSLGSKVINEVIREALEDLLKQFNIIHICGKGNIDKKLENIKGYKQFEYISEELPHMMNAADFVISRAGANVIFELLALKKPNILIPLSKKSSRGDQILNAKSFKKSGYSLVIEEEQFGSKVLLEKLKELLKEKESFLDAMEKSSNQNGVDNIMDIILKYSK